MKRNLKIIIAIVCSLLEVDLLSKTIGSDGNNVIYSMLMIVLFYFIHSSIKKMEKRKFSFACILAFVFTMIEIVITPIDSGIGLSKITRESITSILGYFITFFFPLTYIFDILKKGVNSIENDELVGFKFQKKDIVLFVINCVCMILAWLPYFLRYFPGLLTADSCIQMQQAIGAIPYTNHHPIFHTLIITGAIKIGNFIFGNLNSAVGFYILLQMIAMSISFSIVQLYLRKKNVQKLARFISLLYYMFYPVNALFVVTMWKDILFAGIIPLFVIACNELIINKQKILKNIVFNFTFMSVAVLTALLRNNGIYIVIITLACIFVVSIKSWKRLGGLFLTIIIVYFAAKTAIFNIFKVEDGRVAEMLSIPLQQIARVEKNHRDELDENTKNQINKFFTVENIGDYYIARLSDPVKARLNDDYFSANKIEFIKLWFNLLTRYFKEYVESFITNSYGYYYPEATHWVANRTMEPNNMGLEQLPKIEGKSVEKIDSLIEKRENGLTSMMFSIGMAVWMTSVCLMFDIYNKQYKNIIKYIPVFVLLLTIIASPVFCEYRYAYPIFTTLPIFMCLNFKNNSKGVSLNEEDCSNYTML